jgi:AraC-like DNA-binding protein
MPTIEDLDIAFRGYSGGKSVHLRDAPWTAYDFWRVTRVDRGSGTYAYRGGEVGVSAGDFLLLKPGERRIVVNEPVHITCLSFVVRAPQLPASLAGLPLISHLVGATRNWAVVEAAFQDVQHELARGGSEARARLQVRVILSAFSHAAEVPPRGPQRIPARLAEVVFRLKAHPEERIGVPRMAAMAGYSVAQFARHFRDVHGESPTAFAIRARIAAACRLMEEEGLSVKETACALNYPTAFALSRQFRQVQGYPPSRHAKSPVQ